MPIKRTPGAGAADGTPQALRAAARGAVLVVPVAVSRDGDRATRRPRAG